jgi:tetratricopeptide (TPR) repeat protein
LVSARGAWFDYGLLGDALMEQGKLSAAIIAYQQMINQKPSPQAYNRAASIRWLKGDIEGAIELLNLSASSLNLNNSQLAWTVTQLADYQYQSGNIEISVKSLLALLEKQADYAPALLLLGRIKMAQNEFDSAEKLLTQAIQLNALPQYHWALIEAVSENDEKISKRRELELQLYKTGELGDRRTFALYLASKTKDTERAVNLAEQELQERRDVMSLDAYAWALRSNKQFKKAQEYSKQALAEGTKSARLFYHAGVIANEMGQTKQAELLLKQAKKLEHSLWPSERKHLNKVL